MTEDSIYGDWTRNVILITGPDGKAHGSGFVARRAGVVSHVVTCAHVVSDLGGAGLEVNGRPAKVLYDGTADGIDLAVLAAEGLTEEAQTLSRGAAIGDEVFAIGFTRVDRGRRATARPAKIREPTQLTYDPMKVVKKHPGWILAIEGDPITDGFSGGPVIDAHNGMVIGVLGLRGTGTADAIAISNLAAWRDAPPAVSPIRDEVAALRQSARTARGAAVVLGVALAAAIALLALRKPGGPFTINITPSKGSASSLFGFPPSEDLTVLASSGWQLSRDEYDEGTMLCIEPAGRINLAGGEVYAFAQLWRNMVVQYAPPGSGLAGHKTEFPPVEIWDAVNRFRPTWAGPGGVSGYKDELFDECLLRRDQLWGSLLMVELPKVGDAAYEDKDPFRVLNGITNHGEIEPVGTARPHKMGRKARLAFIVNDAVLSDTLPWAACNDAVAAVKKARTALLGLDDAHQLELAMTPMLAYLDNVGELHVRITRSAQGCAPGALIRPSTVRDVLPFDGGTPTLPPRLQPIVPQPIAPTIPSRRNP